MTNSKNPRITFYPEAAFGGYSHVDSTIAFYTRINALLKPDDVVLDVGCGRGAARDRFNWKPAEKIRVFKGRCQKVIGIDVDPAGTDNPFLDEFRLIAAERWPMDSASIDLMIADFVLEHVDDADAFFAECERVTKPGGIICFRTPNRWNYASIVSSLIPNRWHEAVLDKVQSKRKEADVFPTHYHANSVRALRGLLSRHSFDGVVIRHNGEPAYLAFSRMAYGLGVYLHRWMPAVFYSTLLVFARRLPPKAELANSAYPTATGTPAA